MTDRRSLRSNGTVAHRSLQGAVQAERFTDGEQAHVTAIVTDLCPRPKGPRDRQLLRGEAFTILDIVDGWLFGFAEKDGYVGWVDGSAFAPHSSAPTQRIANPRSYAKTTPGLKEMGAVTPLPYGARFRVIGAADGWAEIEWSTGTIPSNRFVPAGHLRPLTEYASDPAYEAEKLIGTPYLWGGNSSFGLDCSGLVQAALTACGLPCPGDSDQQEAQLGTTLPDTAAPQRGDLYFWKGHVAMATDANTLIHANAHHMAVAYEPITNAITRIAAQGDGPVTSRRRL